MTAQANQRIRNLAARHPTDERPVLVSALSGEGLDRLAFEIEARLAARRCMLDLVLSASDGAGLSWLHRHTEVMAKHVRDDGSIMVAVRLQPGDADRVKARFARSPPPSGELSPDFEVRQWLATSSDAGFVNFIGIDFSSAATIRLLRYRGPLCPFCFLGLVPELIHFCEGGLLGGLAMGEQGTLNC